MATIKRIRERLASQEGFTMIELLVVLQLIGILTLIAVPSYLSFDSKAQQVTAESNVRSAVPAAERWYADPAGGSGSYSGVMRSKLIAELPGVDSNIKAVSLNSGSGYCVEDTNGIYSYDYIGGAATPLGGWKLGVIQPASCLSAAGAAALAT